MTGLTIERMAGVVDFSDGAISPDGTYVACVSQHIDLASNAFRRHVHVMKVTRSPALDLLPVWSRETPGGRTLRFSPDSQALAFLCEAEHDQREAIQVLDLQTRQSFTVQDNLASPGHLAWQGDSRGLYVICDDRARHLQAEEAVLHVDSIPKRWPWWRKRRHLLQVRWEPETRQAQVLTDWQHELGHLAVSRDGGQVAFVEERAEANTHPSLYLHVLDAATGRCRHVLPLPNSFLSTPMFSPSGRRLAYIGSRVADAPAQPTPLSACRPTGGEGAGVNLYDARVWVIDLQDQTLQCLALAAPFCAGTPIGMAPLTQEVTWQDEETLTYVATQGDQTVLVRQARSTPAVWTVAALGSGASRGHAFAADGTLFCFQSQQARPFVPALCLPDAAEIRLFPGEPRQAAPAEWDWHQPVRVTAVPAPGAWLYLPTSSPDAERSVPLIVYLYGGASPLCMVYDGLHQLLVESGYAVLVVNPDGCAGYGTQTADQHVNDWGDSVVDQVVETVDRVLARHPLLTPDAVGVYGSSYGGFLSMLLLARSRRFQAAVSIAGISNIASYWGSSYFGYQYGLAALYGKRPWLDPAFFIQRSPLFLADQVQAPLLLMHGEFDTNVPMAESEQMFTALQTLGRESSLLIFPGEDHAMRSTPRVMLASRRYLLAWFDKHLLGRCAAWDHLTAHDVEQPLDHHVLVRGRILSSDA